MPGFRPAWIPRLPNVDVIGDRAFALANLAPHHDRFISEKFAEIQTRHHGEQVHGNKVTVISAPSDAKILQHPGADGLITNIPDQLLAIYVADCAVIYLADPVSCSIGLLHSGKKGTELNILAKAVGKMTTTFGTNPADLTCVIAPCIRPPDYEIDFAAAIRSQATSLGIKNLHDTRENTATDTKKHYSYRKEKGQTGRMLALLAITPRNQTK